MPWTSRNSTHTLKWADFSKHKRVMFVTQCNKPQHWSTSKLQEQTYTIHPGFNFSASFSLFPGLICHLFPASIPKLSISKHAFHLPISRTLNTVCKYLGKQATLVRENYSVCESGPLCCRRSLLSSLVVSQIYSHNIHFKPCSSLAFQCSLQPLTKCTYSASGAETWWASPGGAHSEGWEGESHKNKASYSTAYVLTQRYMQNIMGLRE